MPNINAKGDLEFFSIFSRKKIQEMLTMFQKLI